MITTASDALAEVCGLRVLLSYHSSSERVRYFTERVRNVSSD